MIEIRIDEPGAGDWIMERAGGHFVPGYSHTLSTHDGEGILGGFVLADYVRRASALIAMAGDRPGWCPRRLLSCLFQYAFWQLDVKKLFALVKSNNLEAVSLCLRVGWEIETTIRDIWPDGVHGIMLYMTEPMCRWLPPKKDGLLNTVPMLIFGQPNADAER